LEQPVLLTLLAVVVWFMRDHWPKGHWRWVPILVLLLTVLNVFFVMTGRSGFLVMLLFVTMAVWCRAARMVSLCLPRDEAWGLRGDAAGWEASAPDEGDLPVAARPCPDRSRKS
jgi:hypothetical protein